MTKGEKFRNRVSQNPIVSGTVIVLFTAFLGWMGWTTTALANKPTKQELRDYKTELKQFISDSSPYARDQSMILRTLQSMERRLDRIEENQMKVNQPLPNPANP